MNWTNLRYAVLIFALIIAIVQLKTTLSWVHKIVKKGPPPAVGQVTFAVPIEIETELLLERLSGHHSIRRNRWHRADELIPNSTITVASKIANQFPSFADSFKDIVIVSSGDDESFQNAKQTAKLLATLGVPLPNISIIEKPNCAKLFGEILGQDACSNRKECADLCKQLSHLLVWKEAFKEKRLDGPLMVFDNDIVVAPGLLDPATHFMFENLLNDNFINEEFINENFNWELVKLGSCDVLNDDENTYVPLEDLDALYTVLDRVDRQFHSKQALLRLNSLDPIDLRRKRNNCFHSYIIKQPLAMRQMKKKFQAEGFFAKMVEDNFATTLSFERYLFNRKPQQGGLEKMKKVVPNLQELIPQRQEFTPRMYDFKVVYKTLPRKELDYKEMLRQSNMCGYGHVVPNETNQNFDCHEARNQEDCIDKCYNNPSCVGFTWIPHKNEKKYIDEDFFVCIHTMNNIFKSLPEEEETPRWMGQCCLSLTDTWNSYHQRPFMYKPSDEREYTSSSANILEPVVNDHTDNTIEKQQYKEYGNTWALARFECQKHGLDLCLKENLCRAVNTPTDFLAYYASFAKNSFNNTKKRYHKWSPMLDECNGWVDLDTCKTFYPSKVRDVYETYAPYWVDGNFQSRDTPHEFILPCCPHQGEKVIADNLDGFKVREYLANVKPENSYVLESLDSPILEELKNEENVVLRAIVNHGSAGFFAALAFALAQVSFALNANFMPYFDFGPCVTDGFSPYGKDFRYFDSSVGPNVFEYFFEQKDRRLIDMANRGLKDDLKVITMRGPLVFEVQESEKFGLNFYEEDDEPLSREIVDDHRYYGASIWHRSLKLREEVENTLEEYWENLVLSKKPERVLGVHLRGTDKMKGISGERVEPEQFAPLIEAFLDEYENGIIFVATDSPKYLDRIQKLFPNKTVSINALRSEKNIFIDKTQENSHNYKKGLDVLLDSQLLSRCNFLLHSNSAVSEFAVYSERSLFYNSMNLQFSISEQIEDITRLVDEPEHLKWLEPIRKMDEKTRAKLFREP